MNGSEAVEALAHSLAGASGGCVALAVTYPLLTATTRLQIQRNREYSSALDTIRQIIDKEGWSKLYAGLKAALAGNIISMGVYYYFYALLMSLAQGRDSEGRPLRNLTTGMSLLVAAGAGAINALVTHPLWTITTRMQANKNKSSDKQTSLWQTLGDVLASDGILGLWKGIVPALVLVSNPSVQYMVFEQLSTWWIAQTTKRGNARVKFRPLSSAEVFVLSAIGKIVATVVTYPLIVVKSRIQTSNPTSARSHADIESGEQDAEDADRDHIQSYPPWMRGIATTIQALHNIFKADGFAGFYSGLRSKIVQSVLTAAIMFVLKEKFVVYTRALLRMLLERPPSKPS